MTAATLFSGIGAPEMAMPDWDWIWHAEIEKFPSAVMADRHPRSVNLGDVTADDFADRALALGRPDVLVFGSPCQSFSVAGRRLGLDDPRGNLALVALGIIAVLRPTWFAFENVPGLFSSAEGRDFGLFLRTVDDLGYHLAWAELDAQFFGLAQRRRRLFAVGHLGDWRYPAAVLLEPDRLCGHPPTRGEAREGVAPTLEGRTGRSGANNFATSGGLIPDVTGTLNSRAQSGGGFGGDFETAGGLVAGTIRSTHGNIDAQSAWTNQFVPVISPAMKARDGKGPSSDGDGDGLSLIVAPTLRAGGNRTGGDRPPGTDVDTCDSLIAVFDPTQITSKANRSRCQAELSHTLPSEGYAPIAFRVNDDGDDAGRLSPTLRRHGVQGVRRLTPRECERLQGFPDDYTLINYRGKPAKDGPRYKAIGNSMAVPVIRWILNRIQFVQQLSERVA